jgi:peptide/nickel transport system permease protein
MGLVYIAGRFVQAVLTLLIVSMLVFVAVRRSGDLARIMSPPEATPQQIEDLRVELGTDKPIPIQYYRYLTRVLHGDLGKSARNGYPARELVLRRLPATAILAAAALSFAIVIGIPIGVLSAATRGSWADGLARTFALLGQAVPQFWAGIVFIIIFSVELGWLPSGGRQDGVKSLILPAIALGWFSSAAVARLTRSGMLNVFSEDYLSFGRARGLREQRVIWRHAFPNALIPIVTLLGIQLGFLLGGAVAVESVFAWPGIGKLMLDSITARDYSVVQAGALTVAAIVIIINLVIDMLYVVIDPRVRVR